MPTSKRKQSRKNVVGSKFRKDKGYLYSKLNGNRDESYVYDTRGGIWHVEFYSTSSTSFIDFENKLKTCKLEEKKSNDFKECKPGDISDVNDSSGQKEVSSEEKGEHTEDSGSEEDAEEICSVRKKNIKKLVRECEDSSGEEENIRKTGRNSRNKFLFVDEAEKSIDKNCTEDKSNLNNSHDRGRPEGAVFSREVRKEKKQNTESCDLSSQDDEEVIRPIQRRIKKRLVESDSSECEDNTEEESSDSIDSEEESIDDDSEKGSIDDYDDDDLSSQDEEVMRPMQRRIKKHLVESDSSECEGDTEEESSDSDDSEEESIDDDSEEKEAAEESYNSSVRFSSNSETEELSRMQRKRSVSQFIDDEAEEGEETDDFVEEEEEEEETDNTSTEDYSNDEMFEAEQFIEREAKEDVPSGRRKRKKYVIDSEEEEQQEGKCETESVSTRATPENIEKSVNLMNKLTKIMFAGQLKSSLLQDIKANEKDMEDTEKEHNVDFKLEQVNTKDCIDNQRKRNSFISKYKRGNKLVDRDCVSEPE